ncbi:MAG TPA: hypothetical protein VHS58_08660 [Acetobacteraceae bacterium]|jgi:hypothetical protein|nr:hypothetical protein [Acetobacteraceae bacterium]
MRDLLIASAAVLGLTGGTAFAQTAPATAPAQQKTQGAPTAATSRPEAPVYGSVQDLQMVDGVPGATYGNGATVSPSGDTVTYVNTVPPN